MLCFLCYTLDTSDEVYKVIHLPQAWRSSLLWVLAPTAGREDQCVYLPSVRCSLYTDQGRRLWPCPLPHTLGWLPRQVWLLEDFGWYIWFVVLSCYRLNDTRRRNFNRHCVTFYKSGHLSSNKVNFALLLNWLFYPNSPLTWLVNHRLEITRWRENIEYSFVKQLHTLTDGISSATWHLMTTKLSVE